MSISGAHIETLREEVARAERELEGWRYLLAHAESVERSNGSALPDPMAGVGTPWPAQTPALWQPSADLPRGVDPYPAGATPVYDGTLPPKQENALGTISAEHDAYARTPDARDEEQKWRQA